MNKINNFKKNENAKSTIVGVICMIMAGIVFITIIASFVFAANVPEQTSQSALNVVKEIPIPPTVEPVPLSERNIAKYNWKGGTTDYLGEYFTSPYGYQYTVITYRLKNDGYTSISTNPLNWAFKADGVTYTYDSASHSGEINTMNVDVGNGGNIVNKIVFLVPNTVTSGSFYYEPLFGYDGSVVRDISLVI